MAAKSKQVLWEGDSSNASNPDGVPLLPLKCFTEHKVFFQCSDGPQKELKPHPDSYVDTWSDKDVRMPCSSKNVQLGAHHTKQKMWTLIERALLGNITNTVQLQDAICSYNAKIRGAFNFKVLHQLASENMFPNGGTANFFKKTLPAMCMLALNLPKILTDAVPLLTSGNQMSLTFSQLQIASIIANMFFCTFPRVTEREWTKGSELYPLVHFAELFSDVPQHGHKKSDPGVMACKREKLRCFLHYFSRVTENMPVGCVTFTRRKLGSFAPNWSNSTKSFDQLRLQVHTEGSIEDAAFNAIQVDFADPYVGGLILSHGCVQEEILFLHRPEMLAACLFTARLTDDETMIIEGAERYSTSMGYANTIRWTGDFREENPDVNRDAWGRWKTTVVAMDAARFTRGRINQYAPEAMLRELNKAYCGFCDEIAPYRKLPSVISTGNWGCGIFRGDVYLKSLLQMMACLQAGKSMVYYTFGNVELRNQMNEMHSFLSANKVTIGQLWKCLLTYSNGKQHTSAEKNLYSFVRGCLQKS